MFLWNFFETGCCERNPAGDSNCQVHSVEEVVRLLERPFEREDELASLILHSCAAHQVFIELFKPVGGKSSKIYLVLCVFCI